MIFVILVPTFILEHLELHETTNFLAICKEPIRIEVTTDSTDVGFSETNLSLVYCHGQALLTSQYRISCYVELDKLRL